MIWLGTWYMLTDFLTDSSKPVLWISHCSSPESQKYLEKYNLLHKPWKSLVFQVHLSCLPLQGLKVVLSGSGIWPKYSVGFGNMHYILTRKGIFNYCLTKAAGFAKVWAEGAGFFFLYIGNSANHTFEQQILINQGHIKLCLLSNQTIECALLISFVL